MHLVSIKLAGFKSFVDATTITLDPSVSVIVGPNGCGKSNILDAVRWAIGESAAQRLRGDLNRDFIFSGSDTRPAASRASVELVFDNQDGRIGGDYASYAELSVRREVHSGEQSSSDYFLNGQRCRRSDVRDVFLGTGFGTRGYSIIQQDWITQLVNSDPETLREHLEEAAGVSRYRARRHETLNKLNLTNQNLEQVRLKQTDLGREIRQLKTQATRARRYEEITESLNRLKTQVLHHRIEAKNDAQRELLAQLNDIEKALSGLERQNADYREHQVRLETALATQQQEQARVAETRIDAQTSVNSLSHRIEQLESTRDATIANIQEKCDQLNDSLQTLESDADELKGLNSEQRSLQTKLNDLASERRNADKDLGLARRDVDTANAQTQSLSEKASEFAIEIADLEAKRQIDEAAIGNLSDLLDVVEKPDVELDGLEDSIRDASAKVAADGRGEAELREQLSRIDESLKNEAESQRDIEAKLNERLPVLQELRDELLSLRTLQEASLGVETITDELEVWLAAAGLDPGTRLGAMLQVESGWESAVEVVLGARLQAIATNQFERHQADLSSLKVSDVALFDIDFEPEVKEQLDLAPSLASKLSGPNANRFASLVEGVYTCDTYADALSLISQLEQSDSIVTADGVWLGKHWVRLFRSEDRAVGVIERSRRSNELIEEIVELEQETSNLRKQQNHVASEIENQSENRETTQSKLNDISSQLVESRTLLAQFTTRRDEKHKVRAAQQQSNTDRRADIDGLRSAVAGAKTKLDALRKEQDFTVKELEEAQSAAVRVESSFDDKQETLDAVMQRVSEAEQARTQLDVKVDYFERSQARQEIVVNRLIVDISALISQGERAKVELPELTTKREEGRQVLTQIEQELSAKSSELAATQQELSSVRNSQNDLAKEKDGFTESLTQCKSQQTRLSIELDQLNSELSQLGTSREYAEVETEIDVTAIEQEIEVLTARLERLGLINYRATTDLEERIAEKEELDEHVLDLESTMAEIRKAIERIDTETKRNLRSTFTAVNENLARVFDSLFGGGTASIEFTDEDILHAGVIVRARPPGKRNSTINMLSGGERAMTAIAFVFALFELNPSPVCILDEVDAPLDERNVVKFAELLDRMSTDTQFVVITHNPATMEMAGNLLGVTMEEAGVSRLVAVNLEDAYALAAQQ
ncbi:MAG: chromosome segregation protein SMC [Gammaproteobacteria bacterium]|nr:chromosome segregation protein SMC [Gammaproteobacteria bacterium]